MRIFFSAGEPSGDQRASEVIRALKAGNASVQIDALGGALMREAGAHITHDLVSVPVIGVTGILSRLQYFRRILRQTVARLKAQNTDVLVLVDYPGFNLRLAEAARHEGIRTVYYIAPQIWAWGGWRIHRIKRAVDLMLVVFEFEQKLYEDACVSVLHVGHPLLDRLNFEPVTNFHAAYGLDSEAPLMACCPGSRTGEVKRLFSVMLQAGARVRQSVPRLQMACAMAPGVSREHYAQAIKHTGIPCALLEGVTHDLMKSSTIALVASGTATLETGLFGTPQLILYRTDPVTAALARMVLKIPGIGLVNVIAEKQVVPEFLQGGCRPEPVAKRALELIRNPHTVAESNNLARLLRSKLGDRGAAERAAKAIMEAARS